MSLADLLCTVLYICTVLAVKMDKCSIKKFLSVSPRGDMIHLKYLTCSQKVLISHFCLLHRTRKLTNGRTKKRKLMCLKMQ